VSAPLRVAFDATFLLSPRTGIGTFAWAVLDRMAAMADIEVTAYAVALRQRDVIAAAVPARVRVPWRTEVLSPLHTRAAWKRSDLPPIEWVTGGVDVVHSPNYVVPPTRRAAQVVSVHDLTFLHHPELATTDTRRYPPLLRRACARGAFVHADSRFIADEIIDAFDWPADRVIVVPLAIDPVAETPDGAGAVLAEGDRYLLAVGTVEPRKNLPRLIAAFDRVADDDPDLRLVLAGAQGWGADAVSGAIVVARHSSRIVRLGWVADDERAALLRGAAALAYPSVYEGFGLPPLEAMSVGTPVVAGAAGALLETCGGAAELVDPHDVDAIEAGLRAVVFDDDHAEELVRRGRANVERFSWDRCTDELLDLYRLAIAGR